MPTKDGFTPEHPLPLFLVEHDEPGVGEAWETTVTSSRILKTSILVVTASLIAFLLVENPATLFANVMALLIDKSALQPVNGQSMPTIRSASGTQALPPTARNEPTRDEIVAAFEPDQSRSESEPSAAALLRQFQAWAAEKDAQAQVGPVQPVEAVPEPVVQNAPAKVVEDARAPVRQKYRQVRPIRNARAEVRPVQSPGKRARRKQNAGVQVPPAQDARAQNQSVQDAQAPSFLQGLGLRN